MLEKVGGMERNALNTFYKELEDLFRETAVMVGISYSAFNVLYAMGDLGEGCLQKEICDYFSVSKTTVNSSVKKLKQQGILRMEPGKGRDMHLYLTKKGETLMYEKIYPVMRLENEIFMEMKEEDRKAFLKLTKNYIDEYRKKMERFSK